MVRRVVNDPLTQLRGSNRELLLSFICKKGVFKFYGMNTSYRLTVNAHASMRTQDPTIWRTRWTRNVDSSQMSSAFCSECN